ncbi:TetR/AcrR family transcriptional regulator [Paenibacillus lignilyticus]|uniref:TetR/AcrR family transcriptional regulator n=1 Tax=Paenibacillus lignilyticus TaxID=1172615 RepID=A0ABS5CAX0_9BACL|nr:TetR/AcrR family transcriptional regulator [Paenibacillus lignilyticus]MBP3963142.1 TetR/AcrR family transcriptional regulator [Paenibacillus lignilyticus]
MNNSVKTDRRILRSKQSITKAFLELFAEKDFELITINEIAERANVNRGTVYLHYSDKYDLLDHCIDDHMNELISLCKNRETGVSSQGMVQEPKPVFDYLRDHFPFFEAMFSNRRVFLFRDRLLRFITVNLMDKMEHPDHLPAIDKELKAQFLASAFIGVVEWWIRQQMPHTTQFMADQVKHLFEKNYDVYAE